VSHDREIMEEDVQDVIKNAKAINLSAENRVVHVFASISSSTPRKACATRSAWSAAALK